MDATIKGENEIGIETQKFLVSNAGVVDVAKERIDYIPYIGGKKGLRAKLSYGLWIIRFFARYAKLLAWADVVHWQYCTRLWLAGGILQDLDLKLIKLFNKPTIGQFHGGDLRNSAQWIKTNPWWIEAYEKDFMAELDRKAVITQSKFADANFCFAMDYGMLPFVTKENEHRISLLPRAIELKQYPQLSKRFTSKTTRIVHAPSHATSKGSHYIIDAVERLSQRRDIEFVLLREKSHDEVLDELASADIVIDQVLCGDYGLLGVEALNAGAVVVCNVNDSLRSEYPNTMPIVQADPNTLEEVLERLIDDPEGSQRIAELGPDYVRGYHGYRAVTPEVLRAYRHAASLRSGKEKLIKKIDEYILKAEAYYAEQEK